METPTDETQEATPEVIPAPATIDHRRMNCSLDDAYIFNYTNNPKAGKAEALRQAGYEGEHVRQEAYRIHNRLRPKINVVLGEILQDLGSLSHQQLTGILKKEPEDVGVSNMLAAIKIGLDYSGNKPAEHEVQTVRPKPETITKRIESLQKSINEIKGNSPALAPPQELAD